MKNQKNASGCAAVTVPVPGTLGAWWKQAKRRGVVYVVTDHVARSNMSARYSFYVVRDDGQLERAWPLEGKRDAGGGLHAEYSAALGKKLGHSLRFGSWVRKGCGYDRAHDVLYTMARHFGDDLRDIPRTEHLGSSR